LLFFLDEQIDIPGWRWAPKSLLASAVDDAVIGIDERVARFHTDEDSTNPAEGLGIPTSIGLKVRLPGYRIIPTPLLPDMPFHAWPEVINSIEDQVVVQNEDTGQWFRILDWYRSKKLPTWTRAERLAYDKRQNNPVCRAIDTGNCALIVDQKATVQELTTAGCLVQVEELTTQQLRDLGHVDTEEHVPLKARRERSMIISAMGEEESKMMTNLRELAVKVARDPSTAEFLQVQKKHKPGEEQWDAAEEKVRQTMKKVMEEAWHADEQFQQTIKNTMGEDLDDYIWVFIPKMFSHAICFRELEERQLWFVD
jgi:hypothetical protein